MADFPRTDLHSLILDANIFIWCLGAIVATTAQVHSTELERRVCVGRIPACSVLEVCDVEEIGGRGGNLIISAEAEG